MRFVLSTSLKNRALMTIAVSLWKRDLSTVWKKGFQHNDSYTRQVKCKLIWHVQKLVLPKILKTELTRFVDGIGSELLQWFSLVRALCKDADATKIFWTPHGTINLKKTVDTLVQDETILTSDRYKLAYICCLEERVPDLWRQLGKTQRRIYPNNQLDGKFFLRVISSSGMRAYVSECFLTHCNSDSSNSPTLPYWHGLYHSVLNGIDISVEYYLQKLAEDEADDEYLLTGINDLLETARAKNFDGASTRILCCFLNAMDEEKQKKLLKCHPFEVLLLFLNWPMQGYFVELNKWVGRFLSEQSFFELLNQIVFKRSSGYQGFECDHIFEEVWKQSSVANKRYAIERYAMERYVTLSGKGWVPCCLFELQYWKTFNIVLEDSTARERKKIIFHPKMCEAYRNAILRGSYSAIECFVKECLVSMKEIIEFRKKMEDRCAWYRRRKKYRRFEVRWEKLFTFLDGLISNITKRTVEGGGNAHKKRRVAKC